MDSKLIGLSVLFFLGFSIFTGYVFFSGSLNVATRASNVDNATSIQNSLIFAWPLSVPADGETTSEVSVFVRNQENRGLEGKIVRIEGSPAIFESASANTDTDGKAVFRITSSTSGVAEISAIVDNRKLERTVSVEFK
jgi:hypothetical protein